MVQRSDPGRAGAAAIVVLALVGLALAAYLTYRVLHPVLSSHAEPAVAVADEAAGLEPEAS